MIVDEEDCDFEKENSKKECNHPSLLSSQRASLARKANLSLAKNLKRRQSRVQE